MSNNDVRVRFAPAPTGFLHVGSARSALFNWLHAKHNNGTFVLRIEDTNAALAKPEYYDAILEPLAWLGIEVDEGPYYQSQRTDLYQSAIDQLLESGQAYLCDCTRDEIDARLNENGMAGRAGYDGHCRDRGVEAAEGASVRFQVPDTGETVIEDTIRGTVLFQNSELEDFVIRRGNGTPVFLVANAVDDADMGITHVVRGEDLLNTTPKVLVLWDALGYGEHPTYAHLPLLVGEDRKKLSKRKHSVALADFQADGYLPEAMANHLALLGWGPDDDTEIRPMAEIIEKFSLDNVNKSPAFFDTKKLDHINATYIRALDVQDFVERCEPWTKDVAPWPADRFDEATFVDLAPVVQDKLRKLSDVNTYIDWLFLEDPDTDEDSWNKAMVKGPAAAEMIDGVLAELDDVEWEGQAMYDLVKSVGEANELKLGKAQAPIRVAITGRTVGLPLFENIVRLPREEIRRRLEAARAKL